MVYKNGPRYRVRKVEEIKEDILAARDKYGSRVETLFFPAGNTIAMKTDNLCEICRFSREIFPALMRITVYGSSQYMHKKGPGGLKRLAEAGLTRIHVGLESGDDAILKHIKNGTGSSEQIEAGRWAMDAGLELSLYVILGIGGMDGSISHAAETARALNSIEPDFIRLRTFVPKAGTPLLDEVQSGSFRMLGPHDILDETTRLVQAFNGSSYLTSDHYTNYINLEGRLPRDKERLLQQIEFSRDRNEETFRPFFIGTE